MYRIVINIIWGKYKYVFHMVCEAEEVVFCTELALTAFCPKTNNASQ
jgi:hypothetical protein